MAHGTWVSCSSLPITRSHRRCVVLSLRSAGSWAIGRQFHWTGISSSGRTSSTLCLAMREETFSSEITITYCTASFAWHRAWMSPRSRPYSRGLSKSHGRHNEDGRQLVLTGSPSERRHHVDPSGLPEEQSHRDLLSPALV